DGSPDDRSVSVVEMKVALGQARGLAVDREERAFGRRAEDIERDRGGEVEEDGLVDRRPARNIDARVAVPDDAPRADLARIKTGRRPAQPDRRLAAVARVDLRVARAHGPGQEGNENGGPWARPPHGQS